MAWRVYYRQQQCYRPLCPKIRPCAVVYLYTVSTRLGEMVWRVMKFKYVPDLWIQNVGNARVTHANVEATGHCDRLAKRIEIEVGGRPSGIYIAWIIETVCCCIRSNRSAVVKRKIPSKRSKYIHVGIIQSCYRSRVIATCPCAKCYSKPDNINRSVRVLV